MRSSIRWLVDAGLSVLWGMGLWLASVGRRRANQWSSPGGQRVLVVAPHPDDELAGCGGVILLHAAAGDQVTVLHVTDGRASRVALDAREVARIRRMESEASLAILGAHRWEWLGLTEGDWSDARLAEPLRKLINELSPQVIYAPSRVDFHPEHQKVAAITAAVVGTHLPGATVRAYQVQVPLTRTLVNLVAPIASVFPRVLQAKDCYRTQEGSLRSPMRLRHYAAWAHHLAGVAEEFWEMTGAAYAVAELAPLDHTKVFRGFRRLALTDPLAYLVGRTARRELRALGSVRS